MLLMAEFVNFMKWTGNCYWYMPLLVLNGFTVCYHTFKLKRYYTRPTNVQVYSYEQKLKQIAQAEKEVKIKLDEALKSGSK